jgi:hypothetical protein
MLYSLLESEVMPMDKEKLIIKIMKECELDGEPITREEAEEMAEMEIKANGISSYTQAKVEKKPRKPREVKKDPTKIIFLQNLEEWLTNTSVSDIIMVNEQREISFKIADDVYSLVLTKHRPKKGV